MEKHFYNFVAELNDYGKSIITGSFSTTRSYNHSELLIFFYEYTNNAYLGKTINISFREVSELYGR